MSRLIFQAHRRMRAFARAAPGVAFALTLGVAAATANELGQETDDWIGVAEEVSGPVELLAPDDSAETLTKGLGVRFGDRIVTGDDGEAALRFLDGTTLQVAPNSMVEIDEFVYDPSAQPDRGAISAMKGLFRLLGGPLEKTDDEPPAEAPPASKSPAGAAGVRG